LKVTSRGVATTLYLLVAPLPILYFLLIVATVERSLVTGFVIGAVIPLVATAGAVLTVLGAVLVYLEYRAGRRVWLLAIAALAAAAGAGVHFLR